MREDLLEIKQNALENNERERVNTITVIFIDGRIMSNFYFLLYCLTFSYVCVHTMPLSHTHIHGCIELSSRLLRALKRAYLQDKETCIDIMSTVVFPKYQ